jgi:hypothetical protein
MTATFIVVWKSCRFDLRLYLILFYCLGAYSLSTILQVLITRVNGQSFYLNPSLKLHLASKTCLLEMTQVNTMCLFKIPLKQMFMLHMSMLMTRMCGFILLLASMVLYMKFQDMAAGILTVCSLF